MEKETENTGGRPALPDEREISLERWEEENVQQYELLMEFYEAAMEKTVSVLKDLSEKILAEKGSNPIRRISSRLKSPTSIAEKLARKGAAYTAASIEKHVQDVAGVRVICPTPNDVYLVAARVLDRPEFTLVRKKDYILKPKETGYRSLHLSLAIDVTVDGESRRRGSWRSARSLRRSSTRRCSRRRSGEAACEIQIFRKRTKSQLTNEESLSIIVIVVTEMNSIHRCACGSVGIGRRARLRILCQQWRVGSSPIFRRNGGNR